MKTPLADNDGKQRKDMWSRFFHGGRTVMYNQNANVSYLLPTGKIPALDWTKFEARYSATYTWTTASELAPTFGNEIQNTQQRLATADLDFTRLYDKWKLLKSLDVGTTGKPPPERAAGYDAWPKAGDAAAGAGPEADGISESVCEDPDVVKADHGELFG